MVREKKKSDSQIINTHLNITLFRESDDKDHPKNPSLLRVKIMDYRKRRSLNVLPVRKHNKQ